MFEKKGNSKTVSGKQEQKNINRFDIGLYFGFENVVHYYPDHKNENYFNRTFFTCGINKELKFDKMDLFVGEFFTREIFSKSYMTSNHTSYAINYSSSHLVFPLGLDIRLGKNKNRNIFISMAYRLDFIFNQEVINRGIIIKKNNEFLLARQAAELGPGLAFKLSNSLQFKFKICYVFQPFSSNNLLISDFTESRIRTIFGINKLF